MSATPTGPEPQREYMPIPKWPREAALREVASGDPARMTVGLLALAYHDDKPSEVEPYILRHAEHPVEDVRCIVQQCLDLMGVFRRHMSEAGIRAAVAGLDDPSRDVVEESWSAFARFLMLRAQEAASGAARIDELEAEDAPTRALAVAGLVGSWWSAEFVWPWIARLCDDPSPLVRAAAYWATSKAVSEHDAGSASAAKATIEQALSHERAPYAQQVARVTLATCRIWSEDGDAAP